MWGGTERSVKTIHAAFERGVNLIDTAPAHALLSLPPRLREGVKDHERCCLALAAAWRR
jgi:hypothetical protein